MKSSFTHFQQFEIYHFDYLKSSSTWCFQQTARYTLPIIVIIFILAGS